VAEEGTDALKDAMLASLREDEAGGGLAFAEEILLWHLGIWDTGPMWCKMALVVSGV
jgi:hypothetical protein